MATTVTSIGLQLLILGTVVQLSYELSCQHAFRAVGFTYGQPAPADFKQIFEAHFDGDITKKDKPRLCQDANGCATGICVGAGGDELFRINGCHHDKSTCLPGFEEICKGKKKGEWKCLPCKGDNCNKVAELAKATTTTTTPEPVTNATSSAITAMPTTHIGISAKLVVAAIVNTVLLMMVAHRAALF
ncbi:hypothetical protein niasHT_021423 [Heterodera trifolii]|uniref:Uncharacterized protein n=1 Tax=Heterodera trifolii TaxID=157864 RepID=A0ABD2K354_9BILA